MCSWARLLYTFRYSLHLFNLSFSGSEYGQLSRETWTFLYDIYDGGPVFFYEEEKDNEEEKQDPRDEEEDIQQE